MKCLYCGGEQDCPVCLDCWETKLNEWPGGPVSEIGTIVPDDPDDTAGMLECAYCGELCGHGYPQCDLCSALEYDIRRRPQAAWKILGQLLGLEARIEWD